MNKIFYLLVFIFSGLFYFLYKSDKTPNKYTQTFQFYTSVKCEQLKKISFYSDATSLVTWRGPFKDYVQLDFFELRRSISENGLRLKIEHTGKKDTLCFLAVNFLIDENIFTLQPEDFQFLTTSPNALIHKDNEQLKIVCLNEDDVWLNLNLPMIWKSDSTSFYKKIYFVLLSLLFFAAAFYYKPNLGRFITAFSITLLMSIYLWYIGKEPSAQIRVNSATPLNTLTLYYNSVPEFERHLSISYSCDGQLTKMQAYPNKNTFYRINFPTNTPLNLEKTTVSYNSGFLKKNWNLGKVKPFQINGSGLDYKNGTLVTKGSDSYLCMTSGEFSRYIKAIDFLRSNLYMLFALLIFCFMLAVPLRHDKDFIVSHFLSYTFLLICFFSPLILLFDARKIIMNDEKRKALTFPNYHDSLSLKGYTKQLDNYLKDQTPGRNQLIFLNNYLKYKLFSELATNSMVYFGKHGWLFYIGENVKELYENKQGYTEVELMKMTRNLEERRDWLKQKDIDYYILFPRLSHNFYQENIGKGLYQFNKTTRLEQFLKYLHLHSNIKVIDVNSSMLEAKKKYKKDLYYKTDTHWNLFGAYFAYSAIIKRIQLDHPRMKKLIPFEEIKWSENASFEADLAKLISLDKYISRNHLQPKHEDISSSIAQAAPVFAELGNNQSTLLYLGKDSLAPRLLMNRDSYSNYLIPYFSKHFSRQTFIWTPLFYPSVIEHEKPDIVITEMMERFLDDLLIDNPPLPVPLKK